MVVEQPLRHQARAGAGGQHLAARAEPPGADRAQLFRLPRRDPTACWAPTRARRSASTRPSSAIRRRACSPSTSAPSSTSSYERALVGGPQAAQIMARAGRAPAASCSPSARSRPGSRPLPRRCPAGAAAGHRGRRAASRRRAAAAPAPEPCRAPPPPRSPRRIAAGPAGGCRASCPARRRRRSTATATASTSRPSANGGFVTAAAMNDPAPGARRAVLPRAHLRDRAGRQPRRHRAGLLDGRDGGPSATPSRRRMAGFQARLAVQEPAEVRGRAPGLRRPRPAPRRRR